MTHVRIGTRASLMALAQAKHVAARLEQLNTGLTTELVTVTTAGDKWAGNLAALGGKGAFVREIERVLLDGHADVAVHCLKDVPGDVPSPAGLTFAAYLARDDVHDAVISRTKAPLRDLPPGSVVGTSSVRRAAQLRLRFPHLSVQPLRGNVDTRLARLDEGRYDAILAAVSGLHRVDLTDRITEVLDLDTMCPPIGAGTIALQRRTDNDAIHQLIEPLGDPETARHAAAERAMLFTLQGHCNSPIAGHATTRSDGELSLRAIVFSLDGREWLEAQHEGAASDPAGLGEKVGEDLLRRGARTIIDATAH